MTAAAHRVAFELSSLKGSLIYQFPAALIAKRIGNHQISIGTINHRASCSSLLRILSSRRSSPGRARRLTISSISRITVVLQYTNSLRYPSAVISSTHQIPAAGNIFAVANVKYHPPAPENNAAAHPLCRLLI